MAETEYFRDLVLLPHESGACQSRSYAFLTLDFPKTYGAGLLALELSFESKKTVQLPLALYDAAMALRFTKASEPASGKVSLQYAFNPGPENCEATPGPWKLVLHKRILGEKLRLRIRAWAAADADADASSPACGDPRFDFDAAVPDPGPGWYCGELHLHSRMSTGRTDIETIRRAALEQGLDFLALTDHFTPYHWHGIEALGAAKSRPLFLRSAEVAGDKGHANLHGLSAWPDPFPDDEDGAVQAFLGRRVSPSMEAVADFVHGQGGLFCVNHPLSAGVSWRYDDFPMGKADLMEVVSLPDGPASFLYPTLWDRFLCQGLKIVAVGSSDSHDPHHRGPWALGRIRNWVNASSLSRDGILEGFKAGNSYIAIGTTRLGFTAQALGSGPSGASVAGMGSTLRLHKGDRAVFTVSLSDNPSGNLFVMKDGLLRETRYVTTAEDVLAFEVGAKEILPKGSFLRVEFHEDLEKAAYHGMAYRDHRSLRALSNPIFLEVLP